MMLLSTPHRVVAELEHKVPGLHCQVVDGRGMVRLIYSCPCGEISMMLLEIDHLRHLPPDNVVAFVLESLRNHVRSEGNVPVF